MRAFGQTIATHVINGVDYFVSLFEILTVGTLNKNNLQDFVSERLRKIRIDNEIKRLHTASSRLPQSSDSVVRLLSSVVSQQGEALVGMAGLVCF